MVSKVAAMHEESCKSSSSPALSMDRLLTFFQSYEYKIASHYGLTCISLIPSYVHISSDTYLSLVSKCCLRSCAHFLNGVVCAFLLTHKIYLYLSIVSIYS